MSLLLYSLPRAVNIHISESRDLKIFERPLSVIVEIYSRFFGSLVLLVFQFSLETYSSHRKQLRFQLSKYCSYDAISSSLQFQSVFLFCAVYR